MLSIIFRALSLAVLLASLFLDIKITASPLENRKGVDSSPFILDERQDDGPGGGSVDPSGVEPEDEDAAQLLADGTGPLRRAVPARQLYTDQATATWYQVQTGTADTVATFTVFTTTTPQVSPIPAPDDQNQIRGPNPWNVDHIFELQVIGEAFKADRPTNIPAADWANATNAVFKSGTANAAIATAVTNLNNLRGIPNALNSFKKQVFTQILTGKGGPSFGNDATFFNFFGPAIQKYLSDNKDGLLRGTVDDTGNQLQSAGNNNVAIKSYFTSYASLHYQGCIDFLSTWSGKPTPTATSSSTSTSTTATKAAVTCEHAADPDNTCAAIANGPGWCDCGDGTKYAIQPDPAPQPCAWTTTPPTTSFDCPTNAPTPTPAPTCMAIAGCEAVGEPPNCVYSCP